MSLISFLRRRKHTPTVPIVRDEPPNPDVIEVRKPHFINTALGFVASRNPTNMRFTPDARCAATFASFHGADAFAKKFIVKQHLGNKPHYAVLIAP